MSRAKRQIASLLVGLVKQNRLGGEGRLRLRGSLIERTRVVEAAHNYRALLATKDASTSAYDTRLNPMIADLRRTAGDRKLSADARLRATERLMWIAGFIAPVYSEPLDERIGQLLSVSETRPQTETSVVMLPKPLPEVADFDLDTL
jgi:hypothetical protein